MAFRTSKLARRLLGLSVEEFPRLAAARVGDHADMERTWQAFQPVANTLVDSFYLALDVPDQDELAACLNGLAPELRGIGYEGAGMGLQLSDALVPTRPRLQRFVHGHGHPYRCLVYIGAGMVLARLPHDPMRFVAKLDPLTRWFAIDGYGFYDGFFRWNNAVTEQRRPRRLSDTGYATNAYDQGVGRSLWFSSGADVDRIRKTMAEFPSWRRPDLWSGIGLACAYAAGVLDRTAIEELIDVSGTNRRDVATGVAVATIFRTQSGQPAPHTDLASTIVWGAGTDQVAALATKAAERVNPSPGVPDGDSYRLWRELIADAWDAGAARAELVNEGRLT